ncbi:MAG: ferrochelatase [Sphingobacteriales bacterium]|nr:ferrochelatase [Sphingobacteriales bacterium]
MKSKQPIAVLLINLGTPDSPATADVRRYLVEFLTDGRVIDIPWLPRQLLVRGIIAPFRAGNSAKSYKAIWTDRGSPLKFHSQDFTEALKQRFATYPPESTQYVVELAMRYQSPSIEEALEKLRKQNPQRYIIVPMFPHYASSSTGTAHQKVMDIMSQWQTVPPVTFINSYHNNEGYLDAFAQIGQTYDPNSYDHVLFSFHGLPERHMKKADESKQHCLVTPNCCEVACPANRFCYSHQCHVTAHELAKRLQIPADKYTISYQSRLGNDPWMQPYTVKTLEDLAKNKGIKRILVFCPAFVADCLETTYEITTEYQEEFIAWGGEKVQLVESLNTHPRWVKAVEDMIVEA